MAFNPQDAWDPRRDDAWDPRRDPEEVYREPDHPVREPDHPVREPDRPVREPWDVDWLLGDDPARRPRGPRPQPRLGWGSSASIQDNPLDHHNHLQGTWIYGPEDTAGGDPEAGEDLTQDMEQSGQHTASALRDRNLGRSRALARPTRRISGRPAYKAYRAIIIPWLYTPTPHQTQPAPSEWAKQTPVSGGTGFRMTSEDYPTSTGWYNQLDKQGEGGSTMTRCRPGTPPSFRRQTTVGCPRRGSTSESTSREARGWPTHRSTPESTTMEGGITCPSKAASSFWEGEWTTWETTPGRITQTKQRSESHW